MAISDTVKYVVLIVTLIILLSLVVYQYGDGRLLAYLKSWPPCCSFIETVKKIIPNPVCDQDPNEMVDSSLKDFSFENSNSTNVTRVVNKSVFEGSNEE